jgi:hypothetical protein
MACHGDWLMKHLTACLTLLALGASAPAFASKPHVHGVMNLNIAVDGPVLKVLLESPQDNLVGHERRPKPGSETTAAAAVLALLRDLPRWIKPDAAAACAAGAVQLEPGRLEGAAKPGEKDSGHADVELSVEWRCQTPAALKGVDLMLLEAFPRAKRIEVQVVGGTGPAKRTLRKNDPQRIVLAR